MQMTVVAKARVRPEILRLVRSRFAAALDTVYLATKVKMSCQDTGLRMRHSEMK